MAPDLIDERLSDQPEPGADVPVRCSEEEPEKAVVDPRNELSIARVDLDVAECDDQVVEVLEGD